MQHHAKDLIKEKLHIVEATAATSLKLINISFDDYFTILDRL